MNPADNKTSRGFRHGSTGKDTYMSKSIGLALLAVGIALIIYGINASDSFGSEAKRFFTGTPTDKSMWLLLGGIAATTVGAVTALRKA
jgi:hypothetical protein